MLPRVLQIMEKWALSFQKLHPKHPLGALFS